MEFDWINIESVDDMVIFSSNKRKLHKFRKEIQNYLKENLGLEMKGNWTVHKFDYDGKGKPLDFMGFKFYQNRTILRKKVMLKMTKKAKRISKKEKPTIYNCKQIMSALGLLNNTNTYNMYLERIKPYINFRTLKKRISRYDRRNNKCTGQNKST